MNLIPLPQKIKINEGFFKLKRDVKILLDYTSFNNLHSALLLQQEIKEALGFEVEIKKSQINNKSNNVIILRNIDDLDEEEYLLNITEDNIEISGSTVAGVFYGVQTLRQIIREYKYKLPNVQIEDKPYFKYRGFYHDLTRGKVAKLETLKKLVDKAAFYKINQLQLYIEHTFAFENMSEVWIDKDPITAEEIILLDEYCRKNNVELVPSIATFGHLYEVLRSTSFKDLCELNDETKEFKFTDRMAHHTLNVSNEGSINLVKNMLEEFIPLFSSNKFNICCDETFDLGKCKSLDLANELGVGKLYVDFLNKVIKIVKSYNKEVMFWGDIIVNHPEVINEIDKDVICLNWNYGHEAREKETKIIHENDRIQYVCPGVAGWNHLMNLIDNSFENIYRMVSYGLKYKAIGVLNTDWGDYGHINLLSNSIPGMIFGGALAWNPDVDKNHVRDYENISKLEFGDNTGSLVSILSKLGKLQTFCWGDLVVWKEKFTKDVKIGEELIDKMNQVNLEELREESKKVLEIEEELYSLLGKVEDKEAMQEFIVSTQGISIITDIFTEIISKEIYNKNLDKDKAVSLAKKFDFWFYDYSKIWRKYNKESELYRIREVIQYTCEYLRNN